MNATGTSLWDKDKSTDPKTWNMEVFIKAVHELQPTLHWKEIIYELDHPGFIVKDRMGLQLLITALKMGFRVQGLGGAFPVLCLWLHVRGSSDVGHDLSDMAFLLGVV